MAPTALFITHRTLPGQRAAVQAIWRRHMPAAITANPAHQAYFYCSDPDEPDAICAFQQYRSPQDASAFLQTEAYLAYEQEVAHLLTGPPTVRGLTPEWSKGLAEEVSDN